MAYRRDVLWPLVLVIVGALLLLRNLGYLTPSLDQWWPVILILIGLWVLFPWPTPDEGRSPTASTGHAARRPTGGLILIALGLALLAGNYLGGRNTGALILIGLGLAFLLSRIW